MEPSDYAPPEDFDRAKWARVAVEALREVGVPAKISQNSETAIVYPLGQEAAVLKAMNIIRRRHGLIEFPDMDTWLEHLRWRKSSP